MTVATQVESLWPHDTKIPIIVVTGPHGSGKTLWGLQVSPERTLVIDSEMSAGSYLSMGFTYVDSAFCLGTKHEPVDLQISQWKASCRGLND